MSRSPPSSLWPAPSPLGASDSVFEVAEGEISAQTDLEELDRFLHNFGTNNNDDDHKETDGAEGDPPVSLASSLTVVKADNIPRSLSAETAGCTHLSRIQFMH